MRGNALGKGAVSTQALRKEGHGDASGAGDQRARRAVRNTEGKY